MALQLAGPLLLAGAGAMGGALLAGWLARGLDPKQIVVQDPAPPPRSKELLQKHAIAAEARLVSLPQPPAVLVVAVKPQLLDEVLPSLALFVGTDTVVLSVVAGRTIAAFERHLNKQGAVVRAMPNMAASVGRAITAAVSNAYVTPAQRATCEALLSAVGEVLWLADETLMDAVTAVSGSGPAYVFHLAECLAEAGMAAGLPAEVAQKLARATVAGAGELLYRSDLGADILRQNVTSPGGTTAAALEVMMGENGLKRLMREAVAAATRRSRELAR
jgi:pyrroline-5-carboxylate reductase